MKRKYIISSLLIVALALFGGWQTVQLVKAKEYVNQNQTNLEKSMALAAFRIQYGQVLEQITILTDNRSNIIIESANASIIYWTENVTRNGSVTLHASAIINGVVLDFPRTQDVTNYLGVK